MSSKSATRPDGWQTTLPLSLQNSSATSTIAPRYLGSDAAGRDVFSYLPGWVPARFQRWSDDQVDAAGRLLRALHEATFGSRLTGWHPVVCHHDPGPNNVVFSGGMPVAFIDFDMAAPGYPLEDIGYMAWTWCISSKPGAPPSIAQATQVRVLANAYGLNAASRSRLPDAVLERQARNTRWWQKRLDQPGSPVGEASEIAEHIRWSEGEHAYAVAHFEVFATTLD